MKSNITEVTRFKEPQSGGGCWIYDETCDNCGCTIMNHGQILICYEPDWNEKDYCKDCYNKLFPSKVKDELYKYFKHMEEEHKKIPLGGMAWDDICWHIHDAVEFGITKEQLAKDFPVLLGHLKD